MCGISVASHTSCSKPPSSTHLTVSMAPRKRAASNVDEAVTTKRSQKAKQPPPAEEPILDEGEQGKDGEGDEKGKGKRGGRGTKRGRAVGKGRGQGGRYVLFTELLISDDHFLQKNISSQGRGGSQSTGTCQTHSVSFFFSVSAPWLIGL